MSTNIVGNIYGVIVILIFILVGCSSFTSSNKDKNNEIPKINSGAFQETNWLPDTGNDRYFIPSGFVVNMEDNILYQQDDFNRIVRYGSNTVVIRLGVGHVSGWSGYSIGQQYLDKLDSYVNYATQAGLNVMMKMTVYDIRGQVQNVWGLRNENIL